MSDLKSTIRLADEVSEKVLLRALVTICYAHWEGHVRFAAKLYFVHIALRKLPFSDLNDQFVKNYFLPRLASLSKSKSSIEGRCLLVEEILNAKSTQFRSVNKELIDTKSNLNSDVLRDICIICGVDFLIFESDTSFIDAILLKRRNAIAHGEETFVGRDDVDMLAEKTVSLMRTFGDALDNRIQLGSFRSAVP